MKRVLLSILRLVHALVWFPLNLLVRDRPLRPFRKKQFRGGSARSPKEI